MSRHPNANQKQARRIFTTTVEDVPTVRPVELSPKTKAEQTAGAARLQAYRAPEAEAKPEAKPE